jgi:hypothetical protein
VEQPLGGGCDMPGSDLKNIYGNLIAGRLPVGSASAIKVVSNHAYAILGTYRLHTFIHERSGFAYYFAIESQFLGSHLQYNLPFIDCFPGRPLHQGDAVYLLEQEDFAAALIMDGGNLRFLCNETDVLRDHLIGIDLPVIHIPSSGGEPLKSVPQAVMGISDKVGTLMNRVSMGVLGVCSLVFVSVHLYSAIQDSVTKEDLDVQGVQTELNGTLNKLSIQQPLAMQISRIQQVSATVVRSGGWIERYTLKGDKNETFEISLPSWVSQDYLDQLGRDVVTDLRDMEGLLIVRKQGKR